MTDKRSHEFTRGLYGSITHTELSSTDPEATRDWCAEVLGWTFQPAFPSPAGDYHLFAYSESGGGGIRHTAQGEAPGSTPTVHVEDTQTAYDAALAAGAESVSPPETVMEGVRIAMVRAPGGVLIGLSGPTD
jgi:predicted enzyme related to lactoylglutathione lyase